MTVQRSTKESKSSPSYFISPLRYFTISIFDSSVELSPHPNEKELLNYSSELRYPFSYSMEDWKNGDYFSWPGRGIGKLLKAQQDTVEVEFDKEGALQVGKQL
ncbi:hypothetical protein L0152_31905, partial [bacterium]|nr:hypothetical protein [bacterium]